MAVGQPKELETAPPPLEIVAPREGGLVVPPRKKGREFSRRDILKLTGLGVAGLGLAKAEEQWGILSAGAKAATNVVENLLESRSGDPSKILESKYLLPTPSEDEIRKLSFIPKAWLIGEGFKRLVSPALQERANAAKPVGFEIIYQDNQNDTVGRTVIFSTKRSIDNHYYDIGFGWWFSPDEKTIDEVTCASITGVFEGWIRPPGVKPNEPDLYMRLGNPLLARDKWLVRIGNSKIGGGAVWVVDNLDIGGDPVPLEAYGTLKSFLSNWQFGNTPSVRINNANQLDKIIRPGDVIKAMMSTVRRYRDENGVVIIDTIYLRRFGGIGQIQKEIQ